jgi:hypothetical protein
MKGYFSLPPNFLFTTSVLRLFSGKYSLSDYRLIDGFLLTALLVAVSEKIQCSACH